MKTLPIILSALVLITVSCGVKTKDAKIREENVIYTIDDKEFNGVVVYNENLTGARPVVLVVHEWWGLNDYPIMRARKLAEMGFIAMAVDMYGSRRIAADPTEAQQLATPFYQDPQLSKTRLKAALLKLNDFTQADMGKVYAIGYCFGGSVVLNAAKLGADFTGVVSFHGGLAGVPPKKELLKAKVLVCNGEKDQFVSAGEITTFKHQMDSIGADYRFIEYPNATHAFTNPDATRTGKKFNLPIEYNKKADDDSWNDMKMFFNQTSGQ